MITENCGRPTLYSEDLANKICLLIIEGYSLRQSGEVDGMPAKRTILRWCVENETFRHHYTRAKEDQADAFAEELLDIVDENRNDWVERENKKTGDMYIALNEEAIARSRLRMDARRWLMGKMKPKKYGDKITSEITGANGGPIEYADAKAALLRRAVPATTDSGTAGKN